MFSLCRVRRIIWRVPTYRWRRQLIRLRNSFQSRRYGTAVYSSYRPHHMHIHVNQSIFNLVFCAVLVHRTLVHSLHTMQFHANVRAVINYSVLIECRVRDWRIRSADVLFSFGTFSRYRSYWVVAHHYQPVHECFPLAPLPSLFPISAMLLVDSIRYKNKTTNFSGYDRFVLFVCLTMTVLTLI